MSGALIPIGAAFDFISGWPFWIGVGIIAAIYGILALGLQLNVGFTGVINFGQVGFMAMGAYSAAILYIDLGLEYWAALPLSLLITMLAGVLIGLPSLRLRADYLAIATIAFAEVIRISARNARGLTGGNQGTVSLEQEDGNRIFITPFDDVRRWIAENILDPIGITGTDYFDLPLLIIAWITLAAIALVMTYLIRSPWGRVLRAVREDEEAARALGKNAFSYKLQSLALSAGMAAVAGWLFLFLNSSVSPQSFLPIVTFLAYAVLVLGGLASFWGVLLGTTIFWVMLEGLREYLTSTGVDADQAAALRYIVAGLILILLMAFRPQGALGKKEEMVLGE